MGERHTEEMRLLGLTIAFYRRARGLTQSELAEAVQISRTHMSNIEAPNSHTDFPNASGSRTSLCTGEASTCGPDAPSESYAHKPDGRRPKLTDLPAYQTRSE